MLVKLPTDMNFLLDKIIADIPTETIDLYSILSDDEFTDNILYDEFGDVQFKDFVASSIIYLDINYTEIHRQLFISLILEIFGDIENWEDYEIEEFETKKEELFEALKDIKIQRLPQGHLDYDMVYTMLEDKLL